MIIHSLKNIEQYRRSCAHMGEAIDYITKTGFEGLKEGKNEVSDNVYIVKIIGDKKSDFEGTIEVHNDWIDIHIPLTDDEIIVYKSRSECTNVEKEYDADNDYMLYNEEDLAQYVLPIGYFSIIDTEMCHMAMLGEGPLEKLVVKVRK
jgi:YhcH/YjgK/YiaL family protein